MQFRDLIPVFVSNIDILQMHHISCNQGLDLPSIIIKSEKCGISFADLLAIPEQDDREYSDEFSTTCVAFIMQIYKRSGLFGPLSGSIHVTEFTVIPLQMMLVSLSPLHLCCVKQMGFCNC